jgi:hypothetical protein
LCIDVLSAITNADWDRVGLEGSPLLIHYPDTAFIEFIAALVLQRSGEAPSGTMRGCALLNCAPTGNCVYVNWPAPTRGAYHQGDATGGDWVGSLIPRMQDASGLLYKRNRYYSPETGQFTQTDPIGIAGGLNTYGFAEGIRFHTTIRMGCARSASAATVRPVKSLIVLET